MEIVKDIAKKSRFLKFLYRQYSLRIRQPSWKSLILKDKDFWETQLTASKKGPTILIATSIGSQASVTTLESLLAVALTLRGAVAHVLLCDSALPACFECGVGSFPNQKRFVKHGPIKDLCKGCFSPANKMYKSLGIDVHRYREFITPQDWNEVNDISSSIPYSEIGKYSLDGLAIGEHALAGALRFYARGSLDGEPYGEAVLRRYLKAALLTAFATERLLKKFHFESAIFIHGIYVPHGIIGEVCRKNKVRVVNWNTGYRKKCFIFSHHDTYHHTMMTEPREKWMNLNWNDKLEQNLMDYLKSRWEGKKDWIWFHETPRFELSEIATELDIDFSKPCIGMLTSVMWDAQLHYPSNAFPNQLDWVFKTIDYFARRSDLQLIIRVHPAEVHGAMPSRQRIVDEIKRHYHALAPNIIIIPPENNVSTYPIMIKCDAVIIYNTKTGIELTAMGIPVVVAGEAWIKNKGFAIDVSDQASYFKILDKLPIGKRMSDENVQKAKKYAYHFFFRRKIPLEFMIPTNDYPPFRIELPSIKYLKPGNSKGLDIICEGTLKGTDFIYQAEQDVNPPK